MSLNQDDRRAIKSDARFIGGLSIKWVLVIVSLVVAISIGAWGFKVLTSDVKGQGDAVVQKNSALNRTQAQAQFLANIESIRSLDQRLSDAQVALDDFNEQHPNVGNGTVYDPLAEQQANLVRTFNGLQQQCRIAVGNYNASADTYTLEDFRDADLPYKIDPNDPAFADTQFAYGDFDCQPAAA